MPDLCPYLPLAKLIEIEVPKRQLDDQIEAEKQDRNIKEDKVKMLVKKMEERKDAYEKMNERKGNTAT